MALDSGGSTLVVGNYVKFLPTGFEEYDPTTTTVVGVITDMQVGASDNPYVTLAYIDTNGVRGTDRRASQSLTLVTTP